MDRQNSLPRIAITMGDPAGIGPETIVRAWRAQFDRPGWRPLVIGHPEVIARAARQFEPTLSVAAIDDPADAHPSRDLLPCLAACADEAAEVPPAVVDRRGGQAAYDALVAAARLALAGKIDALDDRAFAQGGAASGRTLLSRPYGIAGRAVRSRSLRHDALSRGRGAAARAAWPGDRPRHVAHVTAQCAGRGANARHPDEDPPGRRGDAAAVRRATSHRRLR